MSFNFYIKHKMHSAEWRLNTMIIENETLINNLDRI